MAEWNRGEVGGKLPARDCRSCHRAPRATSSSADSRIHKLLPRRSNSRFPGKGHAEAAGAGAKVSAGITSRRELKLTNHSWRVDETSSFWTQTIVPSRVRAAEWGWSVAWR